MINAYDSMRIKFWLFFSLIAIATVSSILDSWIIQYQFRDGIKFFRAGVQVFLVVMILHTLWRYKSIPAYILALGYTIAVSLLHGYELISYFIFRTISALPASLIISSLFLIVATFFAVVLIGLDYVDYRKRRSA
jgi:hypothetical protein